ncbi:hypothetical protein MA16_Dca022773 [Dendrobium catenatum]|uniref:Uncharacterized protein n=1 Tax=Dendrobium catenatum TaxID=906689 RepID=A0A2I0VV85_9ASPA|nr:hypothetical protein MA16_Dca022773 [Dendrobium catenatum]
MKNEEAPPSPWMADPDIDLRFAYDYHGRKDIPRSTFFNLSMNVDDSVEGYINCITFTLAPAIEEHLPIGLWSIAGRPNCLYHFLHLLTNFR